MAIVGCVSSESRSQVGSKVGWGVEMAATVLKSPVRLAWLQNVGELGQWGSRVQAAKSVTLAKPTRKTSVPAGVSGCFSVHIISLLLMIPIL